MSKMTGEMVGVAEKDRGVRSETPEYLRLNAKVHDALQALRDARP